MDVLSISNWKNFNLCQSTDKKSNAVSYPKFGLKMAAPLTQDTVSFQGRYTTKMKTLAKSSKIENLLEEISTVGEKTASEIGKTLNNEDLKNGVNKATAKIIREEALPLQEEIENFFVKSFADLVYDEKNNVKAPIHAIKGRVKGVDSIIEKSKSLGLDSKSKVFTEMTDLNGIKIELNNASPESVKQVLQRFQDAVDLGVLIPAEVENKRPAIAKKLKGLEASQWDYMDPDYLRAFAKNMAKSSGKKVKFNPHDYTKANYTAIHMHFRFPGQKRVFEVQLMGKDVAEYKDFDDILYKCLGNKNVDKKYAPIVKTINKLKQPENKKILENFNKQRRDTFLFQREKEPTLYSRTTTSFLPLKYDIPEEYDINQLYKEYLKCKGDEGSVVKTIAGKKAQPKKLRKNN